MHYYYYYYYYHHHCYYYDSSCHQQVEALCSSMSFCDQGLNYLSI